MDYEKYFSIISVLCVALLLSPVSAETQTCNKEPCNLACKTNEKECELLCFKKPCTLSCSGRDTCTQRCPATDCTMICDANKKCTSDCLAGGCSSTCKGPICDVTTGPNMKDVTCTGDNCTVNVEYTGTKITCSSKECLATCTKGDCTLDAAKAEKAKVICPVGTTCKIICDKKNEGKKDLCICEAVSKKCEITYSAGNLRVFFHGLISLPIALLFVLMK